MRRALVLALVAVASPAHAEMMCEQGPLRQQGFFNQTKVAGSGGVIVAGNTLPDWRFRDLNRVVRPRVTTVAPGLAIYHPPPLADADVTLEDTNHGARVRKQRVLKADPPLGAPAVKSIAFTENVKARQSSAMVYFTDAIPKGALIAVISRIDGAKRIPLAWSQVQVGATSVKIWHTPFACEQSVSSMVPPKPGEAIEVLWVDDLGRVSGPSKALTVARAKTPK